MTIIDYAIHLQQLSFLFQIYNFARKMNKGLNISNQDQFELETTEVKSQDVQNHIYLLNLEQKLIQKSGELSNFIGTHYPQNITKTQSLNQNDDFCSHLLTRPCRKKIQTSSVSPIKKRLQLPRPKMVQIIPKIFNVSDAVKKLNKLKQDILQKNNYSRSSTSSFQNQRIIAYDIEFSLPQPNFKQVNSSKQTSIKDPKQILKFLHSQKKKMTQTISTTSSIQFQKLDSPVRSKQVQSETCLEDFQIVKPLGEGKFGTVYLARHKKSKFICAIKKMPKLFEDQCILEQLIRQIKIQSFLNHPNVCQLYTYFLERQFIYLVLQLCNSGNVYTVLRKQGKFSEYRAKNIIRQVCHAIQYLHQHDIIHRDIKPQNIILHESVVKLCDFGWSVYSPLSRGTLCGTPIYASPELVQRKQYDSKIDIWNIGVLTYQLLFGRVPFQIRCEQDLQKVIDQQIYFPKSIQISDSGKDFIRQCLNKNPQYRISIVKLLDHQFIFHKQSSKCLKLY